MLQFTELLPKTAGVTDNSLVACPLRWFVVALTPITATLNFPNNPFHGKRGEDPLPSVKEIGALAGQARTGVQISHHEEQITQRALKLSPVRGTTRSSNCSKRRSGSCVRALTRVALSRNRWMS